MNLKRELETEKVTHLDLTGFCRVEAGTSVAEVLDQMRRENHDVCLVVEGEVLKGIFTQRDVLLKVAADPISWQQPIDMYMTPDPVTVQPETAAARALWLMDEKKLRDMPVVDKDGRVCGNMTHMAIINYLAARYPVEVLNRSPRPDQFSPNSEGGD